MRRLPTKDSVSYKSVGAQSVLSPSVNLSSAYGNNEQARVAQVNKERYDLYRKYSKMINPTD